VRTTERPAAEVTYRRAEEADLPRAFAVFRAALNAYLVPAGQDPIPDDEQQSPTYLHTLRHDAERFWVAEAIVEEPTCGGNGTLGSAGTLSATGTLGVGGRQIVGWGSGLLRGDWEFLSSLFVLPEAQGLGLGARLFELAGTGAPPGAVRATVTDSLQPVSNNLYARRGLLPREVLIGFDGRPNERVAPPRLGTLAPEPLTLAAIPELREVDAAAAGVDRSVDHEFYLTGGGRYGYLFRRRGRPVGYAMLRRDGWVGPVAAVRARDVEAITAFCIADLQAHGFAEQVRAGVTGRCEGAQRAFWEAGLRFSSTPGLLLSSRPFGRLDRYVAASYGLF
jgi:GNAT superfamily N-acetyltransferase